MKPTTPRSTKAVTLADVAQAAGVSKSTASLALRDDARVKSITKDLIRSVADKLGYIRDPAMSRFSRYRWEGSRRSRETIVYLAHYPDKKERYPWLFPAADSMARELGYTLEYVELSEYPSPSRLSDMLFHRGVRGVFLAPILPGSEIPEMSWSRFSVVASDEGHADLPFHSVRPNYRSALRRCWEYLLAQGCKRPGFALLQEDLSPKVSTLAGEFLFLQEQFLQAEEIVPVLYGKDLDKTDIKVRLNDWIRLYEPDAIIGFNDAVYWALESLDWKHLSTHRAFASVMSSEGINSVKITGTSFPRHLLGGSAIRLLDGMIQNGEQGIPEYPARHLVAPEWINGATES
ncbi:MAG: LacI family transcriptional regulator [Opitutales bacterium]|nr:LacI family transcriptional regulator [Opitutales bacterium]